MFIIIMKKNKNWSNFKFILYKSKLLLYKDKLPQTVWRMYKYKCINLFQPYDNISSQAPHNHLIESSVSHSQTFRE